jgi:hypothetical protein
MHSDYKLLKNTLIVLANYWWVLTEFSKEKNSRRADGNKTSIIKAITTDVLVIAVCVLPILQDLGVEKLWVAFGQGQNLKWAYCRQHSLLE